MSTPPVILDPIAVAVGRAAVDITPWCGPQIDWGDAAIEAYLASGQWGDTVVDYRVPDRVVTIPLMLLTRSGVSFETIRSQVQSKVALFQRAGGWIQRTSAIGPVYADVKQARLRLGGTGWEEHLRGADTGASLELTTSPDWYEDLVDLGNASATTPELTRVVTARGNYPARARITVTDTSNNDRHGVIYGGRSLHYSPDATAQLAYQAEALTPLDSASVQALTGASGGNVVRHNDIGKAWTPVVATTILGGAELTHTGIYRVWARVYSTSDPAPQVRFTWDVGDLGAAHINAAVAVPASGAFYDVDLGDLRLDALPVGAQQWKGTIQGLGTIGGENVSVDRIWFVPVDDFYGVVTSGVAVPDIGVGVFGARDEFNQRRVAGTSAVLEGQVAAVGGTWHTAGSTGTGIGPAPTDFAVQPDGTLNRATLSDGGNGRFGLVGAAVTGSVVVQAKVGRTSGSGAVVHADRVYEGIVARYVDLNNWLVLTSATSFDDSRVYSLLLMQSVAGVQKVLGRVWGTYYATIRLMVTTDGYVSVWGTSSALEPRDPPLITAISADLATGGALASGKVGVYDLNTSVVKYVRNWDSFGAWTPTPDAVVHADSAVELRTDGIYRQDALAGLTYRRLSPVGSDLPRLTPAGLEGYQSEVFVMASRSDFDAHPDTSIDALRVGVAYWPCWLFVPESS